jgi:hypothetical protein
MSDATGPSRRMLSHLADAYTRRDDLGFANGLTVSYREGGAWNDLKRELASVSADERSILSRLSTFPIRLSPATGRRLQRIYLPSFPDHLSPFIPRSSQWSSCY